MALLHDLSIPLRTETLENEVYTFGSRIEEPGETDDSAVLLIDLTEYSTLDDMMVAASKYFPSEEYVVTVTVTGSIDYSLAQPAFPHYPCTRFTKNGRCQRP